MEYVTYVLIFLVIYGLINTFASGLFKVLKKPNPGKISFIVSVSGSILFFLLILSNKKDLYDWMVDKMIPPAPITQSIDELELLGIYRGEIGFHIPLDVKKAFISSGEYSIEIAMQNDSLIANLEQLVFAESHKLSCDYNPITNTIFIENLGRGTVGRRDGELLIVSTEANKNEYSFSRFD